MGIERTTHEKYDRRGGGSCFTKYFSDRTLRLPNVLVEELRSGQLMSAPATVPQKVNDYLGSVHRKEVDAALRSTCPDEQRLAASRRTVQKYASWRPYAQPSKRFRM